MPCFFRSAGSFPLGIPFLVLSSGFVNTARENTKLGLRPPAYLPDRVLQKGSQRRLIERVVGCPRPCPTKGVHIAVDGSKDTLPVPELINDPPHQRVEATLGGVSDRFAQHGDDSRHESGCCIGMGVAPSHEG